MATPHPALDPVVNQFAQQSDPPPITGPSVGRDSDLLWHLGIRLGPVFSDEFRRGFPCQCSVGRSSL